MQPKRIILLAALIALVAKLYCAGMTTGTNDVIFFHGFGKRINQNGLAHTYKTVSIFNHTPLVGGYAALLQKLESDAQGTQNTDVRDLRVLPLMLRLPGIIADFLAVLVLLRLRARTGSPPWWALGIFALSPVAFMVSGFHGNVDSVLALLLLVAACMAVEKQPALCGLALGLACNVKVAPLLLAPVFLAWWWQRGKWLPFSLTAGVVTLVGWAPALLGAPKEFLGNVLGYQGYWGIWGLSYWLRASGAAVFEKVGFAELSGAQIIVMSVTKYLIIGSVLAVAWWRRKSDAPGLFTTLAWVWALFFVCATGIAPQYFVWLAPFLLVVTPRWFAAVTAAASVFMFVFYNVTSNVTTKEGKVTGGDPWAMPWEHPWNLSNSQNVHIAWWGPWQTLPWVVLIGCLAWLTMRIWKERVQNAGPSSA